MATARYWRVKNWRMQVADTDNFIGCSYLEFRDAGGTNLATGGTAIASSELGGFAAANAFDPSTANEWFSATQTQHSKLPSAKEWIGYDFGSAVDVRAIAWRGVSYAISGAPGAQQRGPGISTVEYSSDGSTWTGLDMWITTGAWGDNEVRTYTLDLDTANIRAWRVRFVNTNSAFIVPAEVQWRATVGGADTSTTTGAYSSRDESAGSAKPAAAFDDNQGTAWNTASVPSVDPDPFLAHCFAAAQDAAEVYLSIGILVEYGPTTVYVESTHGGTEWNTRGTWTPAAWSAVEAAGAQTYEIPALDPPPGGGAFLTTTTRTSTMSTFRR